MDLLEYKQNHIISRPDCGRPSVVIVESCFTKYYAFVQGHDVFATDDDFDTATELYITASTFVTFGDNVCTLTILFNIELLRNFGNDFSWELTEEHD